MPVDDLLAGIRLFGGCEDPSDTSSSQIGCDPYLSTRLSRAAFSQFIRITVIPLGLSMTV